MPVIPDRRSCDLIFVVVVVVVGCLKPFALPICLFNDVIISVIVLMTCRVV